MLDGDHVTLQGIMERHRIADDGVDGILFTHPRPRRALFSFSAMHTERFDRWSWHHREHVEGSPTLFAFIKDETQHYYLGTGADSQGRLHRQFIERTLRSHDVEPKQAFTVGSSMGGYAALYFAFSLNLGGAIAVNPQVDYASTRRHKASLWERRIREMGSKWIDLDDFVFRSGGRPKVLLIHGGYPADTAAAEALVRALEEARLSYWREFVEDHRHGWYGLNRERLRAILDLWSLAVPAGPVEGAADARARSGEGEATP